MSKVVLITGGAGFIGSHLSDRLVSGGHAVICVDNLSTSSVKNIAHLLKSKSFSFIEADVSKILKLSKSVRLQEIYHLASPADPNIHSPISYMSLPFETMSVNSTGTWNMCQLAQKHKAKLLFASTSEIYGDPEVTPQAETYRGNVSSTGPRSVYDESKRFGETIVSAFVRLKGMDGRIIRIFNTYGPRMNLKEGRAVVNFAIQALKGKPITIYGDGKQTRSFCYVEDLVGGLLAAMERGKKGQVYNLGNDDERNILEFATIIKQLTRSESEIVFEPIPEDDPKQRRPDITKAKRFLDWRPRVSLVEGLNKTIDDFKNRLE